MSPLWFDKICRSCGTLTILWIWILVFNTTFSYIMATSYSGGGSWSTRREPPNMGKQLVNFITCGCKLSAPFLAHLTQRVMWAILITWRPSYVVNFFKNLLLWKYWTNGNQTWSESLLGYLVSKLCPVMPCTNQHGRCY
jgi:hypothetical protein